MGYPKLFFDNRFSDVTPVASSTATGNFNAANVGDMRPCTWWRPAALPATLIIDQAQGRTFAAQAATQNTLTLAASEANVDDDVYVGDTIYIVSGAGAGQQRKILRSRRNRHINSEAIHLSWTKSHISSAVVSQNLLNGAPSSRFYIQSGPGNCYIVDTHVDLAQRGKSSVRSFNVDVSGLNKKTIVEENSGLYFDWVSPTSIVISGNVSAGSFEIIGNYQARLHIKMLPTNSVNYAIYISSYGQGTFSAGEYVDINGASWQDGETETEYIKTLGSEAVGVTIDTPWSSSLLPDSTSQYAIIRDIDYGIIFGHNLVESGASVGIIGSNDNFTNSAYFANGTPKNNLPFLLEFSSVNYRYLQFRFNGSGGNPTISIAMMGKSFAFPQYLNSPYDMLGRNIVGISNNNENGQPLGSIEKFQQRARTLLFSNVSWSWLRKVWLFAWNKIKGRPVLFAWDTQNYPTEIDLVKVGDSFEAPHRAGGLADLSFKISGVVK